MKFWQVAVSSLILPWVSSGAVAQNQRNFDCWGSYTNFAVNGDASGIELIILSPTLGYAVVAEGSIIGTQLKNIRFTGSRIEFSYWQNKFEGECTKEGIAFFGFNVQTGANNRQVLRAGSFISRKRVAVTWEP